MENILTEYSLPEEGASFKLPLPHNLWVSPFAALEMVFKKIARRTTGAKFLPL